MDERRRTIDEKSEVRAFLAGEAAAGEAAAAEAAVGEATVAEAAAVLTMLESVEVSGLGDGLAAMAVRVEPGK